MTVRRLLLSMPKAKHCKFYRLFRRWDRGRDARFARIYAKLLWYGSIAAGIRNWRDFHACQL